MATLAKPHDSVPRGSWHPLTQASLASLGDFCWDQRREGTGSLALLQVPVFVLGALGWVNAESLGLFLAFLTRYSESDCLSGSFWERNALG